MSGYHPSFRKRIFAVWFRHVVVYTRDLFSNGLPPFLEPIFFLAGIGLGLGMHIKEMAGMPYIVFLSSAIMATPAMYTSAFECSFGTFIRMEFDKVYDGMLAASINVRDLFLGEILFAGSKGFFFAAIVTLVVTVFGLAFHPGELIRYPSGLLLPLFGFLTGALFAAISLFITSFVKNINHFNFYFTGLLTPLFFFSGVVFPLEQLPLSIRWIAEVLPLTHPVRLMRAASLSRLSLDLWPSLAYTFVVTTLFTWLAVWRLKKRLID